MPLIHCPDCGSDVSSEAPTCPKCGRPIAQRPSRAKSALWGIDGSLFGIGLLLVVWAIQQGKDMATSLPGAVMSAPMFWPTVVVGGLGLVLIDGPLGRFRISSRNVDQLLPFEPRFQSAADWATLGNRFNTVRNASCNLHQDF